MPYIPKHKRCEFEWGINHLSKRIETAGELNYVITSLLHNYLDKKKLCYQTLNEIQGVMSCATFEFNRKVISPYEDKKIKENGNVSKYDKN